MEGFKKKFKDTPVIQVDAGNFLYNSEVLTPAVKLQNEQVLGAYSRWPVDVANLGRYDLIFAQRLFERDGLADRTTAMPAMKNIISANGLFGAEVTPPAPYTIKSVAGPRMKNKNGIRIGFIGLAEPISPGSGLRDVTVKDMFETARRLVPQLRKQCDVLVILAHSELKGAMKLAEENPEADIVVAGNAEGIFNPRHVGKTLVLSAAPGNLQQGDLRIYFEKDGRIGFKFRSSDLDAIVPADPAAAAYVENARRDRERMQFNR